MKRKVNAQDVGDLFAPVVVPPSVQVQLADISALRAAAANLTARFRQIGSRCPRKNCGNPMACPDFLVICF